MVVAEGVTTASGAYQLARRANATTPIIDEVYATLYADKDPRKAVRDLMSRDPAGDPPLAPVGTEPRHT
ncbi:MAG: hypothetical protein IPP19_05735 [Verrucomicrobia bacterium]|nr:hypothetical protein [Verrucomicrobiota bacterium]